MSQKKILAIKDFIESSEKSLKNAKKLLAEILEENDIHTDLEFSTSWLTQYKSQGAKIVEWVFLWEEMLGSDGYRYPVPANYASKSKLVQWDKLKMTIDATGKMLYKQILPIPRETKRGRLVQEDDGRFFVVSEGKNYHVLMAAVTYFKWEIGSQVAILLPAGKDATFAAIETVIWGDEEVV